jgi:hypothetical protein
LQQATNAQAANELGAVHRRILLPRPQLPKGRHSTLLVKVDVIHYEIIWMYDFDPQLLAQVRRRKVSHVKCDDCIRLDNHRRYDDMAIFRVNRIQNR